MLCKCAAFDITQVMNNISDELVAESKEALRCWIEAAKKINDVLSARTMHPLGELQPLFDEEDKWKAKYESVRKQIRDELHGSQA